MATDPVAVEMRAVVAMYFDNLVHKFVVRAHKVRFHEMVVRNYCMADDPG